MSNPNTAAALSDVEADSSYDDIVIVRDIAFDVLPLESSVPFTGVAHIAYIPDGHTVAPSKLARIVDHCARRSRSQIRLAREIIRSVEQATTPLGVGVVVTSTSPSMSIPEAAPRGATAITTATTGVFRHDPVRRSEFLRLTGPVRSRR